MANLATKYRPLVFRDLVGQENTRVLLQGILKQGKAGTAPVPISMIFSGSWGSGKSTSARIFSRALLCENSEGDPCNECDSCVSHLKDQNASYREMDAATMGNKEDIEKIKEEMYFRRTKRQIYLFDEAHLFSVAAQNSLLKVLEEPPEGVHFLFATTEPHKIIKTIRSRSFELEYRDITTDLVRKRLEVICEQENIPYEPAALEKVAYLSRGHMRDAIMGIDKVRYLGDVDIENVRKVMPMDIRINLLRLFLEVLNNEYPSVRDILTSLFSSSSVREVSREFNDVITRILVGKYTSSFDFEPKEQEMVKLILDRVANKLEKFVREFVILRKDIEVSEDAFNLGFFYLCTLFDSGDPGKIGSLQAIRARAIKQDPISELTKIGVQIE